MKSTAFWVKRFLTVCGATTIFLLAVYVWRGMALEEAISSAFMWAILSTSIFIGARYYNASKGKACALCRDTVEN